MPTLNINGNILVDTVANWTGDATVYSAKKILISSDALYTGTDQRKFKISNGTDTWANLDYMPIGYGTLAQVLANGNLTSEQNITSDNGFSVLSLLNAYVQLMFDNVADSGGNYIDGNSNYLWHTKKIDLDAPDINLTNETASRILTTDASKNIDSPYTFSTDGTLSGNSDTVISSEKAIKSYADNLLETNDALVFKGVIDAGPGPNYPAANKGHTYKISVAGKIGGAAGVPVEIGDTIYCTVDGSASGNQATVGANWVIVQTNIDGAVVGPVSSTDGNIVLFDGTTGKLIKNSAFSPSSFQLALNLAANEFYARSSSGVAANKTITDVGLDLLTKTTIANFITALGGFGTGSGTFAQGNDARLSDSRYGKPIVKDLTDIAHTGTTAETKVYSVLIPAGTLLTGDLTQLKIKWGATSNGNNKTLRTYFNTSDSLSGATQGSTQIITSGTRANIHTRHIEIADATSDQRTAVVTGNVQTDENSVNNVPANLGLNFTTTAYYFIISLELAASGDTGNIWFTSMRNTR